MNITSYDEYISKVKWLNKMTKEYDEGKPSISDEAWDDVYFMVQDYETEYPENVSPESPTQKITFETISELKKVKHSHPMLSLNKTKDIDEVKSFMGKKICAIMPKMDGLTCSLRYENGELVRAETRGNGVEGEDITHNAIVIPSIPNKIRCKDPLTVDGEIICKYDDFEQWSNEYKNPRNFASGSIRLLDSNECAKRGLTFVAWDMIEESFPFLSNKLIFLTKLGFTTVPCFSISNNEFCVSIEEAIERTKCIAETMSYPIDGVVIKYNDVQEYNEAGRTDHHFKGGLAYKFYDEEYETYLKYIDYDVSRNGLLTPVAVFQPIDADGSIIERASLHNMSVMYDVLGDSPYCGEKIWIIKSNQIIPQVVRAEKKNYADIIAHGGSTCDINGCDGFYVCPICGQVAEIQTSDSGVKVLVCTNENCEGKLVQRLDHFCGKKGLDIKGLSRKTLEKLIDWGWVNNLVDIFKLHSHQMEWMDQPGFGKASVFKILDAIDEVSAEVPLSAYISGLGIPLIGTRVAKQICEHVETWKEFRDLIDSKFNFMEWNGFGPEMYYSLIHFDYTEADQIADYLTFKPEEKKEAETDELAGKNFVITGKLVHHKNRQELVDKIETAGGHVQSAVNAKTNYLINNDITSTSAKNKKAKELNIPIITEEDLMEMAT